MNGKSTRWALPPIWSAPLQFIYLHNASWMARTRRLSSSTGNRLDLAFSTGQGEGGGGMRGEGRHSGDADGSGVCAERADGLRAKSGLQKSRDTCALSRLAAPPCLTPTSTRHQQRPSARGSSYPCFDLPPRSERAISRFPDRASLSG
jgi:hypothetical protein